MEGESSTEQNVQPAESKIKDTEKENDDTNESETTANDKIYENESNVQVNL